MRMFRWMAALALVIGLPMIAAAQGDAGRISGTVRDQSGANVAGAMVTVKNEKTGETRSVVSNDQGFFLITPLKPSTYTIKANKGGFGDIEYPTMRVDRTSLIAHR